MSFYDIKKFSSIEEVNEKIYDLEWASSLVEIKLSQYQKANRKSKEDINEILHSQTYINHAKLRLVELYKIKELMIFK